MTKATKLAAERREIMDDIAMLTRINVKEVE